MARLNVRAIADGFLVDAVRMGTAAHKGCRPAWVALLVNEKLLSPVGSTSRPIFSGARAHEYVQVYKPTMAGVRRAAEIEEKQRGENRDRRRGRQGHIADHSG